MDEELKVFGVIGNSIQQIGGSCPDGWITMTGERPFFNYVANEQGEWVYSIPVVGCSKRQGEFALLELESPVEGFHSFLHWVEDKIDSEVDPIEKRKMQSSFNASEWLTTDQFVQQIWKSVGNDDESLVALFEHARTL